MQDLVFGKLNVFGIVNVSQPIKKIKAEISKKNFNTPVFIIQNLI